MAVWGRAITVLALLAALTGCEYTAEGDLRPSALPSSPSPVLSAPPESTPDPEQEKRLALMYGEVNALLGKPTEASLGIVGPIGGSATAAEEGNSELPAVLTGSGVAEPGQYTVKVVCVGDTEIRFSVHDGEGPQTSGQSGQPDSLWIPCGSGLSMPLTLKGGQVTVEIQGKVTGIEAVGGIQLAKVPSPPAPKG